MRHNKSFVMGEENVYIHPESEEIKTFIKELQLEGLPLEKNLPMV